MSDRQSNSLIERDEQLALELRELDQELVAGVERSLARNPEFTAARFFAFQPRQYNEIVRMAAEGMSHAGLARIFGCSRNLISAIDKREGESATVEQLKRKAASTYRHLSRLSAERLREILEDDDRAKDLSPKDLAVLIGVLEDKASLLSGGPTAVLGIQKGSHDHEELGEYLERLKASAAATGLSGGNPLQRGDDPVAGARTIDVDVSEPGAFESRKHKDDN